LTLPVAGHDDRAAVGIEPKETAVLNQSRRVVCGYPGSGEDALAFGCKDAGLGKQGGIGRDLARSIELFAKSRNAGWKIHQKFS
jgi:hypothetical protein